MENFLCGAVFGIVAFVTYTQAARSREANEVNKARVWMIVSIIAGAITVVNIAAAIAV